MSKYGISGIWKSGTHISHVMLHLIDGKTVHEGEKESEATVMALINNKHEVITLEWNYKVFSWDSGAKVDIVKRPNGKCLSTIHNSTVRDNLLHLLDMGNLNIG